jgi:hypothetical protein
MGINKKLTNSKQSLLLVFSLIAINLYSQQNYKVIYKYESNATDVTIDLKKKDSNLIFEPINISIGEILYVNFSNIDFCYTKIIFKSNPKIKVNYNKPEVEFFNNKAKGVFTLFNENVKKSTIYYKYPVLGKSIKEEKIGNYNCNVYEWINEKNITYKFWICKDISNLIAPYVFNTSFGGVIKIENLNNGILEKIVLQTFKECKVSEVLKNLDTPFSKTKKIMPYFE